ncbi:YceH family protein [Uliginosibacterium sp. 31-16]|uniref:YceH family protein n=1 Tax=Uliginosibacterium sp. 31-16 TaxID=3068315 RepID=UPI00273D8894|nr:YceH family protein [Uliginosibacterium sp. 31-16]MDP5239197.1 YceH family protein [Uliginosibacterium sp. 31-16]
MSEPQQLSPVEARVLGVLVEKQATVPDTYPLSLNALITGCNQKTARDPVMEISESAALEALDSLRSYSLIVESSGGRVTKYGHNLPKVFQLPTPAVAIVTTLILRGPQTVAELRANCERLYRFADASSLEAFLEELATRVAAPLTVLLPRAPGARESRWAHLLCGMPDISALPAATSRASDSGLAADVVSLREEVMQLRAEVAELRAELKALLE